MGKKYLNYNTDQLTKHRCHLSIWSWGSKHYLPIRRIKTDMTKFKSAKLKKLIIIIKYSKFNLSNILSKIPRIEPSRHMTSK